MDISVDIGYGDVKAYSEGSNLKFPSAVAPYSFGGNGYVAEENGLYDREKIYVFEGQGYLVGKQAITDSNCKTTRSQDFIEKYSPLFVYNAVEMLYGRKIESDINIDILSVGIPLATFVSSGADAFKKRYKERLSRFVVNKRVIDVGRVDVFAQGHGIYIDYLASKKDKNGDETVLIIDVGFNTIDILAVVRGVPSKKNSTTLRNKGVVKVISDLQEYLKEKYTLDLSEQSIKDILAKGELKVYGDVIDLRDKIRMIVGNYSSWLFSEIKSQKDDFLQTADRLIVAGGGAYYLRDAIPSEYKGFVYIPDSAEYANARGYYALSQAM